MKTQHSIAFAARIRTASALAGVLGCAAMLEAQNPPRALQLNEVYSCGSGRTQLKVLSCTGSSDSDSCEVQYLDTTAPGRLGARIATSRKSLIGSLARCHIVKPAPPTASKAPPQPSPTGQPRPQRSAAKPPATPAASPSTTATQDTIPAPSGRPLATQQASLGGYRVGDLVEVMMQTAQVTGFEGSRLRVRLPSGVEMLVVPSDVRRPALPPKETRKAPGPPCGAKLEGRWASSTGLGSITIEFRSGKAHMTAPFAGTEVADCFVVGGRYYLRKAGEEDVEFHLNDDGTIDIPWFGELRRKGK